MNMPARHRPVMVPVMMMMVVVARMALVRRGHSGCGSGRCSDERYNVT